MDETTAWKQHVVTEADIAALRKVADSADRDVSVIALARHVHLKQGRKAGVKFRHAKQQ